MHILSQILQKIFEGIAPSHMGFHKGQGRGTFPLGKKFLDFNAVKVFKNQPLPPSGKLLISKNFGLSPLEKNLVDAHGYTPSL